MKPEEPDGRDGQRGKEPGMFQAFREDPDYIEIVSAVVVTIIVIGILFAVVGFCGPGR